MDSVEVIIIKTLVCCHDGFTESRYEVGSKQSFEKDFAKNAILQVEFALIKFELDV